MARKGLIHRHDRTAGRRSRAHSITVPDRSRSGLPVDAVDETVVLPVHRECVPALNERMGRHPAAIVLTATAEDAEVWHAHGPQLLVPLGEVLTFDGTLGGDTAAIETLFVGRTPAKPVRTTNGKKAGILVHIDRLRRELIEHVRAARRYAFDQRDRTGEPRLLERPTKAQLGRLVGLQRYQVTRCFEDPAGRELVLLWEVAADLEQVLRYGG